MKPTKRTAFAAVLAIAACLAASAAERKVLTVEDAVSLAVAHSLGLDAARARTDEAAARTRLRRASGV